MTIKIDNRFKLTATEKEQLAKAIYEAKRANPVMTWKDAMDIGGKVLPDGKKLGDTANSPKAYPWLVKMLEKLGKENGFDVFSVKKAGGSSPMERKNFATLVYKLRTENPGWSWNRIFNEANKSIPIVGRQISGVTQIGWLPPLLKQIEAEANPTQTLPQPIEQPKPVKNPEPVIAVTTEPETTSVREETAPVQDSEIHPLPAPSGMMTLETALINAIVNTVTPLVMDILKSPEFSVALRQSFVAPIFPTSTESAEPVTVPKVQEKRPKILIVGLLPQQGQEIHQLYGKRYDLRIFDSNVTSDKIRSLMPYVDKAIVMTKFISHRVQDVLRGHSGFTHCNGSVAALKELLNTRNGH